MTNHSKYLLLSILSNILVNNEIGDEYSTHTAVNEIDEYFNIELKPEHSELEKSFNKYSKSILKIQQQMMIMIIILH